MTPNQRFERGAETAGFAACFRAPQAKRWAICHLGSYGGHEIQINR